MRRKFGIIMKKTTYALIKYCGRYINYLFEKLGYRKNLSKIEFLPESHFYKKNSFFDSLFSIHRSYLRTSGWLETKSRYQSCKNGRPIPWITYPSFEFLDSMNLKNSTVVEIGAGASTKYFAAKANKVISYEFDAAYSEILEKGRAANTTLKGPLQFLSEKNE